MSKTDDILALSRKLADGRVRLGVAESNVKRAEADSKAALEHLRKLIDRGELKRASEITSAAEFKITELKRKRDSLIDAASSAIEQAESAMAKADNA